MTELDGQYFGAECWQKGLNVEETINEAAKEIGITNLSKDVRDWPPFVHGAEEAWQDRNLDFLDEQSKLKKSSR